MDSVYCFLELTDSMVTSCQLQICRSELLQSFCRFAGRFRAFAKLE